MNAKAEPSSDKAKKNRDQIEAIVKVAHRLFEKNGYEQVGMREISSAAQKSPMQLYRLGLDKKDLLAEVIIQVNAKQIKKLKPYTAGKEISAKSFIENYLLTLYEQDIEIKSIRKEGATFGWKWSGKYEVQIIEQLMQIIKPIADALEYEGFSDIQARCFAIWSLYYVGYRNAVMHDANAQQCLDDINPSLALLLRK
jgi:AcrR family transcriptional regulator